MRIPFLIRLLAATSLPLIAQQARNPHGPPRDSSEPTIRVTADFVLVPVTVTENSGKPVLGLDKRDFVLTDEKALQDIVSFSHENASVSIGIVFDLSGSMTNKIAKARSAVREFLRYIEVQDEVFLVTFSDRAQQRTEFASDDNAVLNELLFAQPNGRTALFDAVAIAVPARCERHGMIAECCSWSLMARIITAAFPNANCGESLKKRRFRFTRWEFMTVGQACGTQGDLRFLRTSRR